jgi:hypothetical protein
VKKSILEEYWVEKASLGVISPKNHEVVKRE